MRVCVCVCGGEFSLLKPFVLQLHDVSGQRVPKPRSLGAPG